MVADLVASGALNGLTRQEVETLLGKRDVTDKSQDWDLVYRLGPERRGLFRINAVLRLGAELQADAANALQQAAQQPLGTAHS